MRQISFKGKTALITGGANGIGKATTEEFMALGASVIVLDKDGERLSQLTFPCQPGQQFLRFAVDISDREAVAKVFEERPLQKVDILVNNAGGSGEPYDIISSPVVFWHRVMANNLEGARNVTDFVLRGMVADKRSGSVVFISSVHTALAFAGDAPYDAAKHALVGLMRSLAVQYGGQGIRINAIAPGAIYPAGSTGRLSADELAKFGERIPLGRCGTPEEIAQVAVFLASEGAGYIHGAEIRVDGGLSIKNALL